MSVNKVNLLIFVLSYLFLESQGLEKLAADRFGVIVITDNVVRKTIAKIFAELQLNIQTPRLKQAKLVHNFFTSISLKDDNTLSFIFEITRVDRVDNDTEQYTTALNDALNEELSNIDLNSSETDDDNIVQYIDEFITNLNNFKESGVDEGYENLDIKDEIIHILKSDDPSQFNPLLQNVTAKPLPTEYVYASDDEFWIPNDGTRRIYQGKRAKIKYFPFMASIHIFKNFQCAGSIIKSDLVVTAASCLQLAWNNRFFRENPAFLAVRVGSNFYHGGGEEVPVMEVYFNPGYDPRTLRNNIAVMRLLRHLKFRRHSRKIKKISIDVEDTPLPMTTDGITILGWGARSTANQVRDPWSSQLAYAVLDVYHLQECQEIYSREYVTKTNFCAGFISKGGGACNHDVGGPGVVNGVLVGIISFGSPVCGTPDAPTVFTKVGFFADWIEEIMEQDVPHRKMKTTLEYTHPFPDSPPPSHATLDTGFKISPIIPTPTPIPLNVSDTLRLSVLENEQLFKEFLNTMFDGKDASEFKALFLNNSSSKEDKGVEEKPTLKQLPKKTVKKDKDKNEVEDIHEKSDEEEVHELDVKLGYHTIMDYIDSKEKKRREKKKKQLRYTVYDKNDDRSEGDGAVAHNLAKFINEVDKPEAGDTLADVLLNIKPDAQEFETDYKSEIDVTEAQLTKLDLDFLEIEYTTEPMKVKPINKIKDKTIKKPLKPKKKKVKPADDILALLYMSDYDKNNTAHDEINNDNAYLDDDNSIGIPIEPKGFTDFTYRNDNATKHNNIVNGSLKLSVLDFISRSELYDLLSEAIDEVTNNENAE